MAQTFSRPARLSFEKIARAAAAEVRVHKKLAVISFVLYGVAALLFIFDSYVNYIEYSDRSFYFTPSMWGLFFAFLGVGSGYFADLNVFRDLSSRPLSDVALTLPIGAGERFFSKLLCLFYIQVAPLIVSILGGNTLALLFRGALGRGDTTETVYSLLFVYLAACLFVMAITVLCACCCGAVAESAYFSLILMFIINALPVSFIYNVIENCSGLGLYWNGFVDVGYWGFLYLFFGTDNLILHCAIGCLVSVIVLLLSGLIFVRRDGRSVGEPIVSRVFFEIMLILGCVTLFSCFSMSTATLWGVLIAGVAYLIINVVVSRAKLGLFTFLKWIGKYLATTAVSAVVLIAALKTGGFGAIALRPAAEYLEGATYSIEFFDGAVRYYGDGLKDLRTDALPAEDADRVMEIVKKHLIQGRSELSAFTLLFGGYAYNDKDAVLINIRADGTTAFDYPPIRGQFTQEKDGYHLDFRQDLTISRKEADAMYSELIQLGYVTVDRPYDFDDPVDTAEYAESAEYSETMEYAESAM
ncbi:MAG: hypothetical protein NC084_02735 [Bacteroides sp.]|nr:hypothetical protein [Eubacterium sp.]MCM1417431.1 hypothetical protein [Roseburia sp.]MCM1461611.1 hypothetical protein [Bacteroides sp.]